MNNKKFNFNRVSVLAVLASSIFFTNISLSLASSSKNQSVAEMLALRKLPPLTSEDIFGAFGAYTGGDGKIVFRSSPSLPIPRRTNLLNRLPDITPALKNFLIKASLCGNRKFQLIYVPYKEEGQTLSISYGCDSSCKAVYERHEKDPLTNQSKLAAMSDQMLLPLLFCESIWNGSLKITSDEKDE